MPKVALIPGHGGFDPGAVNSSNGVREATGNLAVAMKLKSLLEYNGFTVVMSRTTDQACGGATTTGSDVTNQINFANGSGADIAVAIHFNSSADKTAHGTEVLYSNAVYTDPNRKRLASLLLMELVSATGLTNRGLKTPDGISVIKKVKIPVALTECAFVSHDVESVWCSDSSHQQKLAIAHAKALCAYFGLTFQENIVVNIIAGGTKITGQLINNRTWGPMAAICKAKGIAYAWDGSKRILALAGADITNIPAVSGVVIAAGSQVITGTIVNNITWGPVAAVCQALGIAYTWDSSTMTMKF